MKMAKNRPIKLNCCQSITIFLLDSFKSCLCWRVDENKLYRLYGRGKDQIEKELDIIKLLGTLRNMKIFIQEKMMGKIDKLKVQNAKKNVIDLDTDSSHSSEDSYEEFKEVIH